MTDPSAHSFEAFRLADAPLDPRPAFASDLEARLRRRLGAPLSVAPMRRARGLEYDVGGNERGEAVLLIHSGVADGFIPFMHEPALAERYRLVRYHRRGYAGSDRVSAPYGIEAHAADALALLDALGIEQAHVVGHSGSGPIALQLALDAPDRVSSVVLEEPAIHSIDEGWSALMTRMIDPVVAQYRSGDARGALEVWMAAAGGSTWRTDLVRTVPCGPQQMLEDVATFFEVDVEAVEAWRFERADAALISQPVLYVAGAEPNPLARAVMERLRKWVPQTETALIPNANHMLHTNEPGAVAEALAGFFERHGSR
jgi:3-oxoadipate enol-lactonase